MEVGQRVVWIGGEVHQELYMWLKDGMIGEVIEYHPKKEGTGKVLDVIDSEEVIDNGIEEWWTIDFGVAGKRALNIDSVGSTIEIIKE